jgi:hypothetical protein
LPDSFEYSNAYFAPSFIFCSAYFAPSFKHYVKPDSSAFALTFEAAIYTFSVKPESSAFCLTFFAPLFKNDHPALRALPAVLAPLKKACSISLVCSYFG